MSNKNIKNALPPKTKLNKNKYEIVKVLGAGGFGITYLVNGYVGNIKTKFAVKEFFISSLCQRVGTEMVMSDPVRDQVNYSYKSFISEASRLNSVNIHHPNIVSINEVFKQNNTAYYVMEYVQGKNIRQIVQSGQTFSEDEVKKIMAPILQAVALLHSKHIVHYDIKPDNILLSYDDDAEDYRPVLIDFGLSKHYNEEGEATSMIKYLALSPGYAPNEQYLNNEIELFNPQADVYSLAATMMFMLTGKNPEPAQAISTEKIHNALGEKVSEQTKHAISKAMAPLRENRTLSVKELADDLGVDIDSDQATNFISMPSYAIEEVVNEPKSHSKVIKIAAIALVAVAAIAAIIFGIGKFASSGTSDAAEADTTGVAAPAEKVDEQQSDEPATTQTPVIKHERPANPAPAPTPQAQEPTAVKPTPKPLPATDTEPAPKPEATPKKGTLSLGYGTWSGPIVKGKADGNGTVRFTTSTNFHGKEVEPGYTMNATYDNGALLQGTIYDTDGNRVGFVAP